MDTVRSRMAVGAAWMMGLRLIDRSLGIVSTLILARLLLPADFGLIAMAMTILGILEVLGSFSFDIALIQNQLAEPRHYNTAWTLTVAYGGANALALFVLAGPAGSFFSEPRLEAVLYVLALTALVQGFENIGIVAFRKELNFSRELLTTCRSRAASFVEPSLTLRLLRSLLSADHAASSEWYLRPAIWLVQLEELLTATERGKRPTPGKDAEMPSMAIQ